MDCPRCCHPQASDNLRFCTRCGFELNDVKESLVPDSREIKRKKKGKIVKGVKQGVAMMLFGFVLVSVLAILRDMGFVPQVFIKIATLIFCVGGTVRMGFAFISGIDMTGEKTSLQYSPAPNTLTGANVSSGSLPQAQIFPLISLPTRGFDTTELVEPPSVVDDTTKSLKIRREQK